MLFDGKLYFAYSAASSEMDLAFEAYEKNDYPIVLLKDESRHFEVLDLGDGIPRKHDTEAKFLEFVADQKEKTETFTVTILSEKHICESCEHVVKQFKEMFPNATVNIISGRLNLNGSPEGKKTWKNRGEEK